MKTLTKTLFSIAILFGSTKLMAQTADTVKTQGWIKHEPAGAVQIQVTYRQGDIKGLNKALNSNGIPSIDQSNIWFNVSMSHIFNKWMFEDGIGFTPIESSKMDGIKVKYNQYQAYGRLGYNLSDNPDFRFYPFAGLNFSAAMLKVQDYSHIENTNNFTNELLNSTASKTFWQPNFGIELGAGFDYAIKLKPKKMDCFEIERSIPVGIRAGYYINAYAGDWKIDSYTLHTSPNQKQNAVFVSVNIGLGYKIIK